MKLICIPYAGGSAVYYYKWKNYLDSRIEVIPIELAGRGDRIDDPFYESFLQMRDDLYQRLLPEILNDDYVLFGHSMGSTLAYELSQKILFEKVKPPLHVFFSGRLPPDRCNKRHDFDISDNDSFKTWIKKLGGPIEILFDNKEYSKYFLPILLSDYLAIEGYEFCDSNKKLPCDISIFYGKEDPFTNIDELKYWKEFTEKRTSFYEMPGDHFYINSAISKLLIIINDILGQLLRKNTTIQSL